MTNEQQFIKDFNFENASLSVSDLLHLLIGIPRDSINIISNKRNPVQIKSLNFAGSISIKMFKEVKIVAGGSSLVWREDTSEWLWSLCLEYRYKSLCNGIGGFSIATVWLQKDGSIKEFKKSWV